MNNKNLIISELMQRTGVIFGTSGVRGLVKNMNFELCAAYSLAFAKALNLTPGDTLVLAMDLRPSSEDITAACYSALSSIGLNVEFLGELPTPALAYYAEVNKYPAIMVTGSHIPFDRNGIKFYSSEGEITKEQEEAISACEIEFEAKLSHKPLPPINTSAQDLYINRYVDFFPANYFMGINVAFYQHSSVARDILVEILKQLGANVIALGRSDEFTPIDTEAVSEEDITKAKEWANSNHFDVIISTDGDADRPLIGDENGDWLRGDILGLLTAKFLNANAVATPVSCNTAIEKSNLFGAVTRTRIGSPYVIAGMKELLKNPKNLVAGFEANGGFLLGTKAGFYNNEIKPLCTRDAVLPIVSIIALSKYTGKKVSELTNDLPQRFTASDRIKNFPSKKSKDLLLKLSTRPIMINNLFKTLLGNYRSIDTTDGLRVTFENEEIIHYRASGNAPELRCYAEADNPSRAKQLVAYSLEHIQTFA